VVLGIDTSTILGGVALVREGRLLAELRCDARAATSERILPQIDRLMADLGAGGGALARLGVALGPGSFTGVRVGLATAKGLALGWGLPLAGVSAFEARILALGAGGQPVLLAEAPRRGEVFASAGWHGPEGYRALLHAAALPLAGAAAWVGEALRRAAELGRLPLLCAGDGVPALLAALDEARAGRSPAELLALPGAVVGAAPGAVAMLAERMPAEALASGASLDALQPLYLRGGEARRPAERPRPGGACGPGPARPLDGEKA